MNTDDPILTAYALGEPLSPEEITAVEKHLAESEEARAFVEETRAFGALLKGEFQTELDTPLPETSAGKVIPMPAGKTNTSPVLWWSSAAAIATGLLVVGAVVYPGWKANEQQANRQIAQQSTAIEAPAPEELVAITTAAPSKKENDSEGFIRHGSPIPDPETAAQMTVVTTPLWDDSLKKKDQLASNEIAPAKPTSPVIPPPAPSVTSAPIVPESQLLTAQQAQQIGQFTKAWTEEGPTRRARAITPPMIPSPPLEAVLGRGRANASHTYALGPGIPMDERYARQPETPFAEVSSEPLSTFSLDVDTASYANVRRMLEQGKLPPPGAVRLEEMVNYFSYDDPAPTGETPLAVHIESGSVPWRPEHRLVRIGVKAKDIDRKKIKGVNLVFLIDTSGSMAPKNKLPLVKRSLEMLLEQLAPEDRVAIVTYAGSSETALASTPVSERAKIVAAIHSLTAQGGTNGAGGLERAYQTAREGFISEGVNRVILASDGDFNVGMTRDEELEKYIEREAKSGVFLSILGFGIGNYNDQTMKLLSTKGSGNYAYIDTLDEARKVLGEQMRGTLVTVAKDVKIQVEFNPTKVHGYRLLGYENRLLAKEDFNNDQKDAGEVGAGHHVTALYEVIPVGVTPLVDPLKYQSTEKPSEPSAREKSDSSEWLTVKLRYKAPESERSERLDFPFTDSATPLAESSADLRFAAAVAQYAMLLSGSAYAGNTSWQDVIALAEGALGNDPQGYRADFLRLVARARQVAEQQGTGWK